MVSSRVAKDDWVELKSKVHKFILKAFLKESWNKTDIQHGLPYPSDWPNIVYKWSLEPIFEKTVSADQQDCEDYVGLAEFSYNAAMHSATKQSPFKVAYGVDPLQPAELALEIAHLIVEFDQDGAELVKKRGYILEKTKQLLEKAQKCYEKQVNAGRHEVEYEVDQKVFLNVKNYPMPEGLKPKLKSKFVGPFSLVE